MLVTSHSVSTLAWRCLLSMSPILVSRCPSNIWHHPFLQSRDSVTWWSVDDASPGTGLSRFLLICSNRFLFMWLGITLTAEGQGQCFSCMKEPASLSQHWSTPSSSRAFIPHMQSISRSKIQNQLQWIWMAPTRRCKSAATSSMMLRFLQYCWGEGAARAERSWSHLYAYIHSRLYSRAFLYWSVGLDDMLIIAGTVCTTLRHSHIQIWSCPALSFCSTRHGPFPVQPWHWPSHNNSDKSWNSILEGRSVKSTSSD